MFKGVKDWKWESVIIDTIWGGVLFFLVKTIYEKVRLLF